MPEIDDASYERGFALFDSGVSLRSIVEPIIARPGESELEDVKLASVALGFFDALLVQMRRPLISRESDR